MTGTGRDRLPEPKYSRLSVSIQSPISTESASTISTLGSRIGVDSRRPAVVEDSPPIVDLSSPPAQDDRVDDQRAYVAAFALTKKPTLLNGDSLDEIAWRLPARARGAATVTLNIDSNGAVTDVAFDDGESTEFAEWLSAELKANARFSPGYVQDVAVNSKIRLKLELRSLVQ